MKAHVMGRKVHYWASIVIALPLLCIIGSGILLQVKKQWTWVQPPEQRGVAQVPSITFAAILTAMQSDSSLHVRDWSDVNRLDVRPGKGMAKVWLNSGLEVQVDMATGTLMQVAYRRSDLIETIHDGSVFAGDITKLGLFLPAGVVLLVLWVTGLWMFIVTWRAKRRRRTT